MTVLTAGFPNGKFAIWLLRKRVSTEEKNLAVLTFGFSSTTANLDNCSIYISTGILSRRMDAQWRRDGVVDMA